MRADDVSRGRAFHEKPCSVSLKAPVLAAVADRLVARDLRPAVADDGVVLCCAVDESSHADLHRVVAGEIPAVVLAGLRDGVEEQIPAGALAGDENVHAVRSESLAAGAVADAAVAVGGNLPADAVHAIAVVHGPAGTAGFPSACVALRAGRFRACGVRDFSQLVVAAGRTLRRRFFRLCSGPLLSVFRLLCRFPLHRLSRRGLRRVFQKAPAAGDSRGVGAVARDLVVLARGGKVRKGRTLRTR